MVENCPCGCRLSPATFSSWLCAAVLNCLTVINSDVNKDLTFKAKPRTYVTRQQYWSSFFYIGLFQYCELFVVCRLIICFTKKKPLLMHSVRIWIIHIIYHYSLILLWSIDWYLTPIIGRLWVWLRGNSTKTTFALHFKFQQSMYVCMYVCIST